MVPFRLYSGTVTLARTVERIGHPLFLSGALVLWWAMGRHEAATIVAMVLALITMEVLERVVPAKPSWHLSGAAKLKLVGVNILFIVAYGVVLSAYDAWLVPGLTTVRTALDGPLWPFSWPILAQVFLLFFAAEFIYYWIHRAIHNSGLLWRASGHGFHHAFHNLHALNVGATHPFEVAFLVLPVVLLGALFGAPLEAATGASLVAATNATLAHSNVNMDTAAFTWLFTSSNQHRQHHSAVLAESNTNYSCNAILWDRVFGTYRRGEVRQTGIGPRQPPVWQMYLLPFREPRDADTIASRRPATTD